MVETKTAQYMHDIELHFTEKEKGQKQEISIESKGCRDVDTYHWSTM